MNHFVFPSALLVSGSSIGESVQKSPSHFLFSHFLLSKQTSPHRKSNTMTLPLQIILEEQVLPDQQLRSFYDRLSFNSKPKGRRRSRRGRRHSCPKTGQQAHREGLKPILDTRWESIVSNQEKEPTKRGTDSSPPTGPPKIPRRKSSLTNLATAMTPSAA
jgi:hypothetical protein